MERMHNVSRTISLGVTVGCVAALALPAPVAADATGDDIDVAALRARGEAGLATILARYDRTPAGPSREALAIVVDHVAAQRYATTSRLYWYTDLGEAEAAARAQHRPILALRMLGRLDEDLSCANSRL